jgi:hypothetical protein
MLVTKLNVLLLLLLLQVITIDTMIAVNHLGRLDMQICDLDAKGLKQCKDLQR